MTNSSIVPMLLEVSIRSIRTYILYAAFVIAIVLAVACIISIIKQSRNRKEFHKTTPEIPAPMCPLCGFRMTLRQYNSGDKAGQKYWECTNFMNCTGTLEFILPDETSGSDECNINNEECGSVENQNNSEGSDQIENC